MDGYMYVENKNKDIILANKETNLMFNTLRMTQLARYSRETLK